MAEMTLLETDTHSQVVLDDGNNGLGGFEVTAASTENRQDVTLQEQQKRADMKGSQNGEGG